MAHAVVLGQVTADPASVITRQEAHLRLVRASWAAANGLSRPIGTPIGGTRESTTAAGSTVVWSSALRRDRPSSSATVGPDAFHPTRAGATNSSTTTNSSMTLTRRGRFLLIGLPLALGVIALILLGAFLTSQAQAGDDTPVSTVTLEVSVTPGETLWDLAVRHSPDRDPRVVVAEMVELNDLHTSIVQAGQRLLVPVGH